MNREGFPFGGGDEKDHAQDAFFSGGKPTRVLPIEAIDARKASMTLGLGQYKAEKPGDAEVINTTNEAKEAVEKAKDTDSEIEEASSAAHGQETIELEAADNITYHQGSRSHGTDSISYYKKGKLIRRERSKPE